MTMNDKHTILFIKLAAVMIAFFGCIYLFFGEELVRYVEKKSVLKNISSQFFDPDSVEFRNVNFDNGILMCGEVNGKNRYGAYVGFKKFYVVVSGIKDNLDVTVDDDSDFSKRMIHGMCEKKK